MYSSNMHMDSHDTMDIDSRRRPQSDFSMSYSSGGQPPSMGDVRHTGVSEASGSSIQMYSDGQPPSFNDLGGREPSQSEASCNLYEGPDAHEVLQHRISEINLELQLATTHAYFPGHLEQKEKDQYRVQPEENVTTEIGLEPMEIDTRLTFFPSVFPNSDVTILEGHTSKVTVCTWSPAGCLLASGSLDSTARIWKIGDGPCSSNLQKDPIEVVVLKHHRGKTTDHYRKGVNSLDWNGEGTLLATGCYDGQARIWSKDGKLMSTLRNHKSPISGLKWNKKGDYLLSGSWDKTAIVWDIKTRKWKQQFKFHTAPVCDVDWRTNDSFATCSDDSMICVWKVGDNQPVKTFVGHQGLVNTIQWDPTGTLLASCSIDGTAKIWSIKQDTCVHDLKEHTNEVNIIRWSPTGPGTENPNQSIVLATASFDSTIKLWDAETGILLQNLVAHEDPLYSIAFSPNGEYLASGSCDKCMRIWSVKEAKVVKTYVGSGGIFEVCWNKEGDKIGAGVKNDVCIFDFRM